MGGSAEAFEVSAEGKNKKTLERKIGLCRPEGPT
jgi:hypothetical protein